MKVQLDDLWAKTLEIMQNELTEVSFNTWIKSICPIEITGDTIKLSVPNDFTREILEGRYKDLLINAIKVANNKEYKIEFLIGNEEAITKSETPKQNIVMSSPSDNMQAVLNPKYTFDSFVIGNSNRFAHAASLAVSESPAKAYNPLFIYGGVGLGKTHLMHAIGNYLVENTNKKVLYITSDKFVDEYTRIFRYSDKNNFEKIDAFKEKYRNVDVLMIDDIQFLSTAPKGQEEFFHTFNELHNANKQIIIASDRSVDDLNSLENRLLTRFNWGLTANINTPDFDLRVSIIKNKLAFKEAANDIPDDVIEYIANNFDSDIRKLEGAITRVLAYASMFNKGKITLDIAVDALKDQLKDRSFYKNDVQRIQRVVCDYYKISIEQMKGKNRNNAVNFPRQVAIYLCRELTNESFPKIGSYFGGRNHSTIISADQKIRKELVVNDDLKEVIKNLKRSLT